MFRNNRLNIRNHSPEAGFTLLEVMISLGILSIIFTLIYGTFSAVSRGIEHMEKDADAYQLARLSLYHMANHLSMLHVGVAQSAGGASSSSGLLFRGEDGERLSGDEALPNDSLAFSTVSHGRSLPDAPESDRQSVRYSLLGDVLIQEALLANGHVVANELGGPIAGLSFRYLENGSQWQESWDADEKGQKVPQAVEIELILKQGDRPGRRFKTWVDLPMGRIS